METASKPIDTRAVELWALMGSLAPRAIMARAQQVEADGWDGMNVYDSQCLVPEAVAMMTAAAVATERLQLSISTSNPITRHPSVAASAIATIADIAGHDRVSFGIGRGDSSLAWIGGAPARVAVFERYVSAVRRYLHGESVPFADVSEWLITRDVSSIELAEAPVESRIRWIDPKATPPAIEIYATGPRVLAVAGRRADRVCLALGADIPRIRWAIDVAREARAAAGLDPSTLKIAAIVPTAVADDITHARRLVDNTTALSARFAVIDGRVAGPVSDRHRAVYEGMTKAYDMTRHGDRGSQINLLTDEFIDDFSIVGPPERCVERVLELYEAGVTQIALGGPQNDIDKAEQVEGYRRLVEEVVPAVRSAVARRTLSR